MGRSLAAKGVLAALGVSLLALGTFVPEPPLCSTPRYHGAVACHPEVASRNALLLGLLIHAAVATLALAVVVPPRGDKGDLVLLAVGGSLLAHAGAALAQMPTTLLAFPMSIAFWTAGFEPPPATALSVLWLATGIASLTGWKPPVWAGWALAYASFALVALWLIPYYPKVSPL